MGCRYSLTTASLGTTQVLCSVAALVHALVPDWRKWLMGNSCQSCCASNSIELPAEACLHFPGLSGLKTDPIFVFPKTLVCLVCGFTQSKLSETELEQVRKAVVIVTAMSNHS
jgi:hypothetical protein